MNEYLLKDKIIKERCKKRETRKRNRNSHPYAGINQIRFIGFL